MDVDRTFCVFYLKVDSYIYNTIICGIQTSIRSAQFAMSRSSLTLFHVKHQMQPPLGDFVHCVDLVSASKMYVRSKRFQLIKSMQFDLTYHLTSVTIK